jgi:hypothetical protein
VAAACLAACLTAAAPVHARPYHVPHTAYGAPDLQGTWTNVSVTRLERKPGLPLIVARAEEAAYEKLAIETFMHPPEDALGQRGSEWQPEYHAGRIDGRVRTSWIVSPADGRLPYRPGVRERHDALVAAADTVADDPETRTIYDRCLMGASGPPISNPNSAGAKQIVQTPSEVVILSEANHDVRIVRLNGRHPPNTVRVWAGDSIGHWEKDTLVVETTNFHPQETQHATFLMSAEAHITERFTRVSPTELRYAFEVDDPANYTQPWRAEMPFLAERSPIYEYACHEGNYSLPGMLAGARKVEADARKAGQGH